MDFPYSYPWLPEAPNAEDATDAWISLHNEVRSFGTKHLTQEWATAILNEKNPDLLGVWVDEGNGYSHPHTLSMSVSGMLNESNDFVRAERHTIIKIPRDTALELIHRLIPEQRKIIADLCTLQYVADVVLEQDDVYLSGMFPAWEHRFPDDLIHDTEVNQLRAIYEDILGGDITWDIYDGFRCRK